MEAPRLAAVGLAVLCIVATVGGCYPVKISPECKSAIDACLAKCGPQGTDTGAEPTSRPGGEAWPTDYRGPCEAACQDSCTQWK